MTKKLTREKFMEILRSKALWTNETIADELEELGYIEPEKEPLTFSQIRKECVSGESVLVDEAGIESIYVGFRGNNYLVTDRLYCNFYTWSEAAIANWTIKPKEEKKVIEIDKEVWINVSKNGSIAGIFRSRESAELSALNNRISCEKFHLKRSVEV